MGDLVTFLTGYFAAAARCRREGLPARPTTHHTLLTFPGSRGSQAPLREHIDIVDDLRVVQDDRVELLDINVRSTGAVSSLPETEIGGT